MIDGKRVVAWTPFGREPTYSILIKYFAREVERGLIDEVWAYENLEHHSDGWSNPGTDYEYLRKLEATLPDWFKVKKRPEGCRERYPVQRQTGYAYRYMTDPDTVYLRFDDDIIYIHEAAIENLVRKRLANPEVTAVFASTWNNSIVSWFWQRTGLIPVEFGEVEFGCMDPIGWGNGNFAVKIHEQLLGHIEAGTVPELYSYQDFELNMGTQFSVSCFASLGSMYANLPAGPGVLSQNDRDDDDRDEEEAWHTKHRPREIGIPNLIAGTAFVSHFTFKPQKPRMMTTNILQRYEALAVKLT